MYSVYGFVPVFWESAIILANSVPLSGIPRFIHSTIQP